LVGYWRLRKTGQRGSLFEKRIFCWGMLYPSKLPLGAQKGIAIGKENFGEKPMEPKCADCGKRGGKLKGGEDLLLAETNGALVEFHSK